MKNDRKTEIKVGIMSLAGIIILLWVLGWAKDFSLTSREKELLVKFPQVSGLEVGDYVTVNGVRKGNVESINLQREDVLVKISLANEVDLKEDAAFAVVMLDLMGGKKVEVKPGISERAIDYSQIHNGEFYADIPSVMSLFGSVQDDLLASIKEIRITLTSMNNYLTDEELNKNLKESIKNLNQMLVNMQSVLDQNRENFIKITNNTAELTKTTSDFLNENKESISSSINDLNKIFKKTDSLLVSLNNLTEQTVSQKNNLGKILYDKEFMKKIEETLDQLNEMTKIITEQLKTEGINVDANVDLF
jgi:phospholipid/cholesterol/gamma-HCH transport system substrate-binding protein